MSVESIRYFMRAPDPKILEALVEQYNKDFDTTTNCYISDDEYIAPPKASIKDGWNTMPRTEE